MRRLRSYANLAEGAGYGDSTGRAAYRGVRVAAGPDGTRGSEPHGHPALARVHLDFVKGRPAWLAGKIQSWPVETGDETWWESSQRDIRLGISVHFWLGPLGTVQGHLRFCLVANRHAIPCNFMGTLCGSQ